MSRMREFDEDNPEWTAEDFKQAKAPHEVLPLDVVKAFLNTQGTRDPVMSFQHVGVLVKPVSPEQKFKRLKRTWQKAKAKRKY